MNVRTNVMTTNRKKVVFTMIIVAALLAGVGLSFSYYGFRSAHPNPDATLAVASPTGVGGTPRDVAEKSGHGVAPGNATHRQPTRHKASALLNTSPIELNEIGPIEIRYDCDADCPAGYEVSNTTGSKTEARWLHAAGFPTVAEYKHLTENDAALAEAMRRSDAGDARAAAILGHYFLQEGDYLESGRQLARAELQCNVFAFRVQAQSYIEGPEPNMVLAATRLRMAYLLGDQEAAPELATLMRAANLADSGLMGMIDQDALAMLNIPSRNNNSACRFHGVRPRPGMRNLE